MFYFHTIEQFSFWILSFPHQLGNIKFPSASTAATTALMMTITKMTMIQKYRFEKNTPVTLQHINIDKFTQFIYLSAFLTI